MFFNTLGNLVGLKKNKEGNKNINVPIYFTRDQSKKLIIGLKPEDDLIKIEEKYKENYQELIPRYQDLIGEYKYIMIDVKNLYHEYLIINKFKPYSLLKSEKYELYYIRINIKNELISDLAINHYFKIENEENSNNLINQIKLHHKIKYDTLLKFSRKEEKYIKVDFTLYNDSFEIIKKEKKYIIPIYYIISIDSHELDKKYKLLDFIIGFPEKMKNILIAIPKSSFKLWESLIYNQFVSIKRIYEFHLYNQDISNLIKKRCGLLVQVLDKKDSFEGMLINKKTKFNALNKIKNQNVKKFIQFIINYKLNVFNKEYESALQNLNGIIDMLYSNQEFYEEKKDLQLLLNTSNEVINKKNELKKDKKLYYDLLKIDLLDKIYNFCYNNYLNNINSELLDNDSNNNNLMYYITESNNDLINLEICINNYIK